MSVLIVGNRCYQNIYDSTRIFRCKLEFTRFDATCCSLREQVHVGSRGVVGFAGENRKSASGGRVCRKSGGLKVPASILVHSSMAPWDVVRVLASFPAQHVQYEKFTERYWTARHALRHLCSLRSV